MLKITLGTRLALNECCLLLILPETELMAGAGQCDCSVLMWRSFALNITTIIKKDFLLCIIDISESYAFPNLHLYYWVQVHFILCSCA